MAPTALTASWATLLLALWSTPAAALTCARSSPAPQLLYPPSGATVPRDVTLFLRPGAGAERRLVLAETGGERKIWLRIERQPGLWRLAPTRLLAPGRAYQLRQLGELRSKPSTVLATFRTARTVHRGGRPAFRRASLEFSTPAGASMRRRAGRSASLSLEASPAPAVVELRVAFRRKGKWSATWRSAASFAPSVEVATTGACDFEHPTAPARGRYRVTLIPWGPSGERGQVLRLKGVIR